MPKRKTSNRLRLPLQLPNSPKTYAPCVARCAAADDIRRNRRFVRKVTVGFKVAALEMGQSHYIVSAFLPLFLYSQNLISQSRGFVHRSFFYDANNAVTHRQRLLCPNIRYETSTSGSSARLQPEMANSTSAIIKTTREKKSSRCKTNKVQPNSAPRTTLKCGSGVCTFLKVGC